MKILKKMKWLIFAALILLASIYYWDTIKNIVVEVKKLPSSLLVICLALGSGFFVFEGKIIQFLANKYVPSFRYRQGLECAYYCAFYRFATLGTGTGVAEVYYLSKSGIPASKATGIGVIQYAFQKIVIALYGSVGYLLFSNSLSSVTEPYSVFVVTGLLITVTVSASLIAIGISRKLSAIVILLLDKLSLKFARYRSKIESAQKSIVTLQEASSNIVRDKKKLLLLSISNICKLTCWYLIPAIILYRTSDMSIWSLTALMAICNMLAGVIPSPSGVGALEFTFFLLFSKIDALGTVGSAFIMYRFATWIFPFIVGFLIIGLKKIGVRPGLSDETE